MFVYTIHNRFDNQFDNRLYRVNGALECRSEMCCTRLAGNAGPKHSQKFAVWAPSYNFVGLYLRNWACIDNRKKNLLNINTSPTCPYSHELRLTSGWDWFVTLVHPCYFQRVLAALLHGTLVVGVSQSLRRWTKGATYIRQGGHHVGHWPHSSYLCSIIVNTGSGMQDELDGCIVRNAHNSVFGSKLYVAVYFLHSTWPSVTWLNSRSLLAVCNWVMSALSGNVRRRQKFGVGFLYEVYRPGEWLWIDSNSKNEN